MSVMEVVSIPTRVFVWSLAEGLARLSSSQIVTGADPKIAHTSVWRSAEKLIVMS